MDNIIKAITAGLFENAQIAQIFALIWAAIKTGDDVVEKIKEVDEHVGEMVAQGRRPSAAEWLTVEGKIEAASGRIQAAARARARPL